MSEVYPQMAFISPSFEFTSISISSNFNSSELLYLFQIAFLKHAFFRLSSHSTPNSSIMEFNAACFLSNKSAHKGFVG